MRILIDTSIHDHANSFKGQWEDHGTVLWGGKSPVQTGGVVTAFDGHRIRESKGGDQNGAIGALAEKFKDGSLVAVTTDALTFERFDKPFSKFGPGGYGDVNLLSGTKFESLHTLEGLTFSLNETQPIVALRSYLRQVRVEPFLTFRQALDDLANNDRNSQDAWHLHCCDAFKLDRFLTADTKLVGQIRSIPETKIRSQLLELVRLPTDLCKELEVDPLTEEELSDLSLNLGAFPPLGK